MKKNPYVFTPEFSKDKTNNEYVQGEGIQNMSNESKNNCENGSVYLFGNNSNHHSYLEINQCSNPQQNSEKNKEFPQKPYNSYTSKEKKNKYSFKELLNKTNELIKEISNTSQYYYSRNNKKIITTNNTMTSPNYIKSLPPKASNSKATQKDIINSYKDKKVHKKNAQAKKVEKNTKIKSQKSPKSILNSVMTNENNPNRHEKKNYNSNSSVITNSIKTINININLFNKNSSSAKKKSPKISNKDSKFNNGIHLNNLNRIHPKVNANIDNDNNIQMPKKNQSLEEMMKVMVENINKLTVIQSQNMNSQKKLNDGQNDINKKLDKYIVGQNDINKKLDKYIDGQNDINEKLDKYIDGQNDINVKLSKYLDDNNKKNNKK